MSPALVQQVASKSQTSASVVITVGTGATGFSGTTAAGNKLILAACTGGGATITGITDSRGNVWAIDKQGPGGSGATSALCSTRITTPLITGDTITLAVSVSQAVHAGVLEFSGTAASDQAATAHVTGTSDTVATTVSSQAGDLIVAAAASGGATSTISVSASDPASGGTWTDMAWPYAGSVAGGVDIATQAGKASPSLYSVTCSAPTALNMDVTVVTYKAAVIAGNASGAQVTAANTSQASVSASATSASSVAGATTSTASVR